MVIFHMAIENDPVEIVDFPIKNGGSFHSVLYVYQRVPSMVPWSTWLNIPKNDGKSPFVMGKSPFVMGKSPFVMGKSPFFMGKSPFFMDPLIHQTGPRASQSSESAFHFTRGRPTPPGSPGSPDVDIVMPRSSKSSTVRSFWCKPDSKIMGRSYVMPGISIYLSNYLSIYLYLSISLSISLSLSLHLSLSLSLYLSLSI